MFNLFIKTNRNRRLSALGAYQKRIKPSAEATLAAVGCESAAAAATTIAIHEEQRQFIKKVLTFQLNKFLFTLRGIFFGALGVYRVLAPGQNIRASERES